MYKELSKIGKKALELGSESEILKRKIADKKYYEGEE
jgi:hypothetical protein